MRGHGRREKEEAKIGEAEINRVAGMRGSRARAKISEEEGRYGAFHCLSFLPVPAKKTLLSGTQLKSWNGGLRGNRDPWSRGEVGPVEKLNWYKVRSEMSQA